MGKLVKYCTSCEEGFAERFGFCPDCGAALQTFEMNPVAQELNQREESVESENVVAVPVLTDTTADVFDDAPLYQEMAAEELDGIPEYTDQYQTLPSASIEAEDEAEILGPDDSYDEVTAASVEVPETVEYYRTADMYADEPRAPHYAPDGAEDDGGYHVTVIQEKNVRERNLLLLGSTFLMVTLAVGGTILSLFNKSLGIDAIGDERSIAMLIEDVPMPVEEKEVKKEKDKGGGGGGGGEEEKEPTSQGDLADQTPEPIRPPDVRTYRSDNFELKTPVPTTQGDQKFEKKHDRWGDPNSAFAGLSNGIGSGGGQGSGTGTGQGSGSGTGAGSGTGSGSGGGNGNGNGDGVGDGSGGRSGPPPPPVRPPVTTPFRLISRPKANYTDAARTNAVTGNVRLKVTLLASGQVGSITPVTRLPHGLTEQAIAAARQIRFEPKKVNGVAVPVIVTFDYNFNIY